jgi:hypothetical protein
MHHQLYISQLKTKNALETRKSVSDTINATNGGVILSRPMTNTSGSSPNNMVSASANDYVNLNGYQNQLISPMYCNLYQMADTGTTALIQNS